MTVVKKMSSYTMAQHLREIYALDEEVDSKTNPIKLSATQKKALADLMSSDELKDNELADFSKLIWQRDPTLKVFFEISCAIYRNKHEVVGRKFITQAAKLVSDCDFLNPLGSSNIFFDVTSQFQSESTPFLQVLVKQLLEKFDKRRKALVAANDKAEKVLDKTSRTKLSLRDLNSLEANILAIAALWCHALGKVDTDGLINAYKLYKTTSIVGSDDEIAIPNMAVFIAKQISRDEGKEFIEIIDYFVQQESNWKAESARKSSELNVQKKEMQRLAQQRAQLSVELNASQERVIRLEQQIEQLKIEIMSSQVEQKSERVHLQDDTERLRARSYNLLTDEIHPLLTTSLKALRRETPIVEVAIDHIERANEQIEGAIKWFKR